MRLRSWVVLMTVLLSAIPAMADTGPYGYPSRNDGYNHPTDGNPGPRWYGYYFNNGLVSANADHTNVTMIGAVERNEPHGTDTGDQQGDATNTILARLQEAKDNGEKAIVDVEAIVFQETGNPNETCYLDDPTATQDFNTFVLALEHPPAHPDDPYLIPKDPVHSTVSAFYVADEPDRSCEGSLRDGSGIDPSTGFETDTGPAPALVDAITAIRQGDTVNFPLATIVTKDGYSYMMEGLTLFDWVGEDDYGNGVTDYLNEFVAFEYILRNSTDWATGTPQRYFLVPLVSWGPGKPYIGGAPSVDEEFLDDDRVIGIMPFKWQAPTNSDGSPNSNGMNATSSWAHGYITLGKSIVQLGLSPPPPPPPPPPPNQQMTNTEIIITAAVL